MNKELKAQGKSLKAVITIGKEGLNENGLENIRKNLVANKLTKIKLSRAYIDSEEKTKKEIVEEIAKKLQADVIDVIGFVAVFHKR